VEDVIEGRPGGDRVQDGLLSLEQQVRPLVEGASDLSDEGIRRGLDGRHETALFPTSDLHLMPDV
jgi:hypothetical protein